jgi:hypothetical protein
VDTRLGAGMILFLMLAMEEVASDYPVVRREQARRDKAARVAEREAKGLLPFWAARKNV